MIAAICWTGGKDSVMAYMDAVENGYDVQYLVTFAPENPSFKAHPLSLMAKQAAALGKPHLIKTIGDPYAESYEAHLRALKDDLGVECIVTGDIDYIGSSKVNYMEARCIAAGLTPYFPLWQRSREELLQVLIQRNLHVIFSCVKTAPFTPVSVWLGRRIDADAVEALKTLNEDGNPIDICGENGEYHTMVLSGPCFQHQLEIPSFTIGTVDKLSYMKLDNE